MKAVRATATWARAGVYYVRTEAMVYGFHIALEGEFDTDTPESEYILVMDDAGMPVSTCRIHAVPEEGYAKIERVATVSTARKCGAGRLAIAEAEKWILEKNIHKVIITSRDEAVGFYEKLGYTADYTKDCRTLFPSPRADKKKEKSSPQFTIVYMEKKI
ncbi:MAG: GNAT family N-acetyltransferase [Bacillus sp. (in: Bacteria)]|nr:GNAT family N-acetyltransferase [Bacillus sp. (in: firmicutes)]MCM1427742.1 GNAT family N-acetyltransferase [Eubacterium sp.]